MYEVCNLLNQSQIKKLISIYAITDYENPVSPDIIKEIAKRCSADKADTLFLESKPFRLSIDFKGFFTDKIVNINRYIPPNSGLRQVEYVLKAE